MAHGTPTAATPTRTLPFDVLLSTEGSQPNKIQGLGGGGGGGS